MPWPSPQVEGIRQGSSRLKRNLAPPEGVQLVDTPPGVCALLSWFVRFAVRVLAVKA